jgi:hypothetical protein
VDPAAPETSPEPVSQTPVEPDTQVTEPDPAPVDELEQHEPEPAAETAQASDGAQDVAQVDPIQTVVQAGPDGPAPELELDPIAAESQALVSDPYLPEPLLGDPVQTGFAFEGDRSCWCHPGLPPNWTQWVPPVEASPDSYTDLSFSTDWGLVESAAATGATASTDVEWATGVDSGYAGINGVGTVVSEAYGTPVDTQELVDRAAANGWLAYDEDGEVKGIRGADLDDVLASYGVPSHGFGGPEAEPVVDEEAWQALNDALANEQRVVLGVDDVGGGEDRLATVTAIDYERGVVLANDVNDQASLEIPIDRFFAAWRESNFAMTVTDATIEGDGTELPPDGAGSILTEDCCFAYLGVTLQGDLGEPLNAPGFVPQAEPLRAPGFVPEGDLAAYGGEIDLAAAVVDEWIEPVEVGGWTTLAADPDIPADTGSFTTAISEGASGVGDWTTLAADPVAATDAGGFITLTGEPAPTPGTGGWTELPATSGFGTMAFGADGSLVLTPEPEPTGYAIAAPFSPIRESANATMPTGFTGFGLPTMMDIQNRQTATLINMTSGIPSDVGSFVANSSGGIDFIRSGESTPSAPPPRS